MPGKKSKKVLFITLILLMSGFELLTSQNKNNKKLSEKINEYENTQQKDNRHVLKVEIIDGDTIPHVDIDEVTIMAPWKFKNKKEQITYTKLARNVKKALPYARIASEKLYEINSQLVRIKDEKARKQYLKKAEKDLFTEFETPLRNLTFSQGKILIKLIDRETGNTGFELIKEYRGGVSAFFWQGIARIFGANLKDVYKPDNEDAMIEHIIKMIDLGLI
jgi:hypothetical protein